MKRSRTKSVYMSEESTTANDVHCVKASTLEVNYAANGSQNQLGSFESRGRHRAGIFFK